MWLKSLAVLLGIALLMVAGNMLWSGSARYAQVNIGPEKFKLEVAKTPKAQRQGLMHRTDLAPCGGMVFLFNTARPLAFWMHNTPTPLWMAFVDDTGRIVRLIERASPNDDGLLESYLPATTVIEIAADCPQLKTIDQSAKVTIIEEAP